MNLTIAQLKVRFGQALSAAFGADYGSIDPILVPASNPKFGDYQANVSLSLAKPLGQAPRAIAAQLVQQLDVADLCEPPTIAGPGFINLTLKTSYLEAQIKAIQSDPRLGVVAIDPPQRVIVDYPSPNIAKEMHVGHLRPAIIGDCIARILEFIGHDVLRISHIGDWGTPFGMLIAYLRVAYPEALTASESLDLGDLSTFYRQAKQRFDADEAFREAARLSVVQLQAGDEETLQAWRIVCALSSRSYRVIYDLMGIAHVVERGESFYNPLLADVVEDLQATGLLLEDNGAQCVFLDGFTNKEGKPLPLIVQKSDGGYNYATTDLAAIRYRVKEDKAQRVIYPVGMEQTNHFMQIFQVGQRAGWITDAVEFIHTPFGLVLGEDNKKLKTRSGEAVRLQDLLDEAIVRARADLETRLQTEERQESEDFIAHAAQVTGISAIKYADLSQNRTSNYIFSYDRMLSLQGNTAPYLLYAYVRVQGISRKGQIDFGQLGITGKISLRKLPRLLRPFASQIEKWLKNVIDDSNKILDSLPISSRAASLNRKLLDFFKNLERNLTEPTDLPIQLQEEPELVLAKHLLQLDEILAQIEQDLLPNRLCQYLFELSQKFNRFYEQCPILDAEEPLRTSRLILADLTARSLKLGLSLLGIPVLERM